MSAVLGRALLHRGPVRQLRGSSSNYLRQSRPVLRTMASSNDAQVKLDKDTPESVSKFSGFSASSDIKTILILFSCRPIDSGNHFSLNLLTFSSIAI